jgi:membrane protein DedA with SNARE-associated domain
MSQKPNNSRKYIQFTSIPFEMGAIILAGYKLGEYLDTQYPNDNHLYTVIGMLSAVFISMGYIIIRIRKLTK